MVALPGRVGAKWFGSGELSTATALGLFGQQVGASLAFLLPPLVVKFHRVPTNHQLMDKAAVGADLSLMFRCVACLTTVNLALMVMCTTI